MRKYPLLSATFFVLFFFHLSETGFGQCSVNAGNDTAICSGQVAFLHATPTGTPPYSYSWTPVSGLTTPTQRTTYTGPLTATTSFTVSITDANNCVATDQVTVTVRPLPIPNVTGQSCVCVNLQNVVYSTPNHSGSTYSWTVDGGTITSGQNTNQISVNWGSTPGSGTVTVTESITATGCLKSNTLNVTISNTYPSASFIIVNNNVCSGTAVNFQGPAGAGYTYLWNFGDLSSGSSNTSSLQNPSHVFLVYGCNTAPYIVTLTVTNSCGCISTTQQTVTIKHRPNPQLTDADPLHTPPFSNCVNSPTAANPDFLLTVTNVTTYQSCITSYQIDWGDGTIEPKPAGFSTASHTYHQLGIFNLIITAFNSTNGCSGSTTYVVGNQSEPSIGVYNNGGNTSGCAPLQLCFTILGAGTNSPGTTYALNFGDGTSIITKTNDELLADSIVCHTYQTSSCESGYSGQFTLTVSVSNTCLTTDATLGGIRIYKPPIADFLTNPQNNGCVNTNICFINTSTPGYGTTCNTNTNYNWNLGDGTTSSAVTPPCHQYSSTGIFNIRLIAGNNQCPNADTVIKQICISPQPISSFTVNKTTDCVPFTVNATNTSPTPNDCADRTFTWSVIKNGSSQCTPSSQNYTLTPSGNNATILFQDPGDYSINLNVKNSCNAAGVNFSQQIIAKSVPRVTVNTVPDICQAGSISPTASFQSCYDPITEYLWTFTGGTPSSSTSSTPGSITYSTPGTYSIKVRAKNSCGWSTEITSNIFTVKSLPTVNAGSSQTICQGGNVVLAGVVGGSATGGTWSTPAGGTFSPSANSLNATWTPPSSFTGTAALTLTTTGMSPCSAVTSNVSIIVKQTPTVNAGSSQTICQGGSVVLAGVVGGSATGGTWSTPAGGTFDPNANSLNATWTPPSSFTGTAVLTLTTTGMSPCSAITSNVSIIVKQTPTASAGTSQSICQGGSATLAGLVGGSATGGTWSTPVGGTFSPNANTLNATWTPSSSFTGTAFLTLTTSGMIPCSAVSSDVTITVLADPIVTTQPLTTQTLCQNASPANLGVAISGGTGTPSYQWYSNTVNNNTTGTIIPGATGISYTPPTSTVGTTYYYCVITQTGSGCSVTSSTAAVIVNAGPSFTDQPASSSVCLGGNPTLLTVAYTNGAGTPSYQWYVNTVNSTVGGTAISGATNPSYQPPAIVVGTKYYYCVITFSSGGCSNITSNIAQVDITPAPTITTQPTPSQSMCVGGMLSSPLSVSYSGGSGTPSYQWYSNTTPSTTGGTIISGATSSTYTPPAYTSSGNYYYYAVVSLSGSGCSGATSDIATVTVLADPVVTTQPLATQTLCQNASPANLGVAISGGTGTPSYQWYSNTVNNNTTGTLIPGATGLSYTPPTSAVGTTYYYCVITQTGSGCSVTSSTAAVIVNAGPSFTDQPASSSVCLGGNPTLLTVAYTNGAGTPSYQWYVNTVNSTVGGTAISGATNPSYQPPAIVVGTKYYYCVITFSSGGCSNITSNIAQVETNPIPLITSPLEDSVCSRNPFSYTITSNIPNCSYGWLRPLVTGISNPIGSGTSPSITETLINTTGLDIDVLYEIWTIGPGISACISDTMSLIVKVKDFSISAGTDVTIPFGTRAFLAGTASGGGGNLHYQWEPSGQILNGQNTLTPETKNIYAPTTFTLYVSDLNMTNCSLSDDVDVVVTGSAVAASPTIDPSLVCPGGQAQLFANPSGGSGIYTYTWSSIPQGNPIWTSTQENPLVNPFVPTTYTVIVNDGFNTATGSVSANIKSPPDIFNVTGGGHFCAGELGVSIGLSGSSTMDMYVLKDQSGNSIVTITGNGSPLSFGVFDIPGIYTVEATSISSPVCSSSMNGDATITVIPLPDVYSVTGGGSYPAGGQGIIIGLSDSQTGVEYELSNTSPILPRIQGTGGPISFGLQTTAGTYLITAYTLTVPVCSSQMLGSASIIINPWPSTFQVTGGGEICEDDSTGVTIGLSNSEVGVTYQLFRNGSPYDIPQPGIGDSLVFGPYNKAGQYHIAGTNDLTSLTTIMSDTVSIIIHPLPMVFILYSFGDNCPSTELLLNGSQLNVEYSLLLNDNLVNGSEQMGTGNVLSFGLVSDTGLYRVYAQDTITGCDTIMDGSIFINPSPEVYHVMPNGINCAGDSVWLEDSDAGIVYYLLKNITQTISFLPGTGTSLSFGPQFEEGEYAILAVNPITNCDTLMDGTAILLPLPQAFTMIPDHDTCAGTPIGLNGSETGIRYILRRDLVWVDSTNGSGFPITFPIQHLPGNYTIIAYDTTVFMRCPNVMNGSVTIYPNPQALTLTPQGFNCPCVVISLDTSEIGVSYQLYYQNNPVGLLVAGTGGLIDFGQQCDPGTYKVIGSIGSTGCWSEMANTVEIIPNPTVFDIDPVGDTCAGVRVRLMGSQMNVNYELYITDISGTRLMSMLPGSLGILDFGIQNDPGTYSIRGYNTTPDSCWTWMNGSVTLHENPNAYLVMPAFPGCVGDSIWLADSDPGVDYYLYNDNPFPHFMPPSVTGTGSAISFGNQYQAGNYTVEAINQATNCSSKMTGSAVLLDIPLVFSMSPQGDTCAGSVRIKLNSSQTGVLYRLVRDPGSINEGEQYGSGGELDFGIHTISGSYYIKAVNNAPDSCDRIMNGMLNLHDLPMAYNIIPQAWECVGSHIWLDDSDIGIKYQLLKDGGAWGNYRFGDGDSLDFGQQDYPGTYTALATDTATGCFSTMIGDITLYPIPTAYLIVPENDTCAGAQLGLNGSQVNVIYELRINGSPVETFNGTGNSFKFNYITTPGIYTVLAYNTTPDSCYAQMTGMITIYANPLVFNLGPQGALCEPRTITLDGSQTGVDYQLLKDGLPFGVTVPGNSGSINWTGMMAGIYHVIANRATPPFCEMLMPDSVVISALPLVDAGLDTTICETDSSYVLDAVASNFSSVSWTTSGDGYFLNPYVLQPAYYVGTSDILFGSVDLCISVVGTGGCINESVSSCMTLFIDKKPEANAGSDVLVCLNDTAFLSGTADHYSEVIWSAPMGDGLFENPASLSTYYIPGSSDKAAGGVDIYLHAIGTLKCVQDTAIDSLHVTLHPLPYANAGPDDTVCATHSYLVSQNVASDYSNIVWSTSGTGSFNFPTILHPLYTPSQEDINNGFVTLTFTINGEGPCVSESDSDQMLLFIYPLPQATAGQDTTICSTSTLLLSDALASNYSSFQWITSGDGLFNPPNSLHPVYHPGIADTTTGSATLTLIAYGAEACSSEDDSSSIVITFQDLPDAVAGNDTSVCANSSVQLNGFATLYSSVHWSTTGDGNFSDNSILNPTYTPGAQDILDGFVYLILTVNGSLSCAGVTNSDTLELTILPLPTAHISGTTEICSGDATSISVFLFGTPPWSITYWDGYTPTTVNNIGSSPYIFSVSPNITTAYTLLAVSDSSCMGDQYTGTAVITINPLPLAFTVTATGNGAFCEGGQGVSIGLDGSQLGVRYQIHQGGVPVSNFIPGTGNPIPSFGYFNTPGLYSVYAVDTTRATDCDAYMNDTINVIVNPLPNIDFHADTTCLGEPTHFSLLGTEILNIVSWVWDFGDGSPLVTYNFPFEPDHTYPVDGTYNISCVATDQNGCIRTRIHPVYIAPLPLALFGHSVSNCMGDSIHFTSYSVSYPLLISYLVQWIWDFGDGTYDTINFPDNPDVFHAYSSPGTFEVILTVVNNLGCMDTIHKSLSIIPAPVTNFTWSAASCEDMNLQFTDLTQINGGSALVEWKWYFDDPVSGVSNTSILQNPTHLFTNSGVYDVMLIVINSNTCRDTMIKPVLVNESPMADFEADTACLGTLTNFTDISLPGSGNIVEWDWDFGDGSLHANIQNPVHLYSLPGIYNVKLTVENSLGCIHDTILPVKVVPLPVANFTASTGNCEEMPVQFTNMSSTSSGFIVRWTWLFGDGTSTTVSLPYSPNVTHIYSNPGNYNVTLTVKTSDSCIASITKPIVILAAPIANFDYSGNECPDVSIHFDDQTQLNGGGALSTWNWDFDDPASGSNNTSILQDPEHIFSNSGIFDVQLIVTNVNTCKDTITKQVTIGDAPVAMFTSDTACFGSPTSFTDASTTSNGSITNWDWDFGDGTPHSTLQNPTHIYNEVGTFDVTLTVTNSGFCVHDTTIQVEVRDKPEAMFSFSNTCEQSSTQFTDESTTATGGITAWIWDFGDGGTSTVQNPTHTYASTGTYYVTLIASNSLNCSDTITIPVMIHQTPTADFTYTSYFCPAGEVAFQNLATGNGATISEFYWTFEPGYFSTQPNPTYTYNITDTCYLVSLIVTTEHGCKDTAIHSDVCVKPGFNFTVAANDTCFGKPTQLHAVNLALGDSLYYVIWNFGDPQSGPNNQSTSHDPQHVFTSPGTFIVKLKAWNSNNCADSIYKEVVVNPAPVADFAFDQSPCDSVINFYDLSSSTYSSIQSWIWDFGDGSQPIIILAPDDPDTSHQYTLPGSYLASLIINNGNGCIDSITKSVTRFPCIIAAFEQPGNNNCQNEPYYFIDSSGPPTRIDQWHWTFGDGTDTTYITRVDSIEHWFTSPGNYQVKLLVRTSMNGLFLFDSTFRQVQVHAAPVPEIYSNPVCYRETAYFIDSSYTVAGDSIIWRKWRFGDPTTGTNDTSTMISPSHDFSRNGVFHVWLKVKNANNCVDSIRQDLRVYKLPEAIFENSIPCVDHHTQFFDLSTEGDTTLVSWWWDFGDPGSLYPSSTLQEPSHIYDSISPFDVFLRVEDQFGCIDTISHSISVLHSPVSLFTYLDNYGDKAGAVQFTNLSTGANSYEWSFGNGETSTLENPFIEYTTDGTYIISLVAQNADGCYDSTFHEYKLLFKGLYVPNAFSPTNVVPSVRLFKPVGSNLKEYHIMVLDSWGHVLWQSTKLDSEGSPVEEWDGRYNGDLMPQGTYMWVINAMFKDGTPWEGSAIKPGGNKGKTRGTVTLIR